MGGKIVPIIENNLHFVKYWSFLGELFLSKASEPAGLGEGGGLKFSLKRLKY